MNPEEILFGNHFQDPCEIYGCTFFCPVQGLSHHICLSFRMADHRPTGRIKKSYFTSPNMQTMKANKKTSLTPKAQNHPPKNHPPSLTQKAAGFLSENLAGWVLSSLHGPGDMPPSESQRLPKKHCAAPPIRSAAPRIDRAPKHGHLSSP